jgi:hypothetical protein
MALANISGQYQNTLGSGTTVLYTAPTGYRVTIGGVTFNNPAAYNITFTVNRVTGPSSVNMYSFVLAAGDVVTDNNGYVLNPGDSVEVTISAASTNCFFTYSGINTGNI